MAIDLSGIKNMRPDNEQNIERKVGYYAQRWANLVTEMNSNKVAWLEKWTEINLKRLVQGGSDLVFYYGMKIQEDENGKNYIFVLSTNQTIDATEKNIWDFKFTIFASDVELVGDRCKDEVKKNMKAVLNKVISIFKESGIKAEVKDEEFVVKDYDQGKPIRLFID